MFDPYDYWNGDSEPQIDQNKKIGTLEFILMPLPAIGLLAFIIYMVL